MSVITGKKQHTNEKTTMVSVITGKYWANIILDKKSNTMIATKLGNKGSFLVSTFCFELVPYKIAQANQAGIRLNNITGFQILTLNIINTNNYH
jgi:hypothetical protein